MGAGGTPRSLLVVRGVIVAVVAVPVMVVGAAVAAVSFIQFFVAGWDPFGWLNGSVLPGTQLDWAYGGGRGSGVRFFTFMVGGVVASGAYWVLHWAFTGRFPD